MIKITFKKLGIKICKPGVIEKLSTAVEDGSTYGENYPPWTEDWEHAEKGGSWAPHQGDQSPWAETTAG